MPNQRWTTIQALRAVAAWAVAFGHILLSAKGGFEIPIWLQALTEVAARLCHAGVDLFFVISGAIMYLVTKDSRGGLADAGQFMFRRSVRIYPLFWLAMAAAAMMSVSGSPSLGEAMGGAALLKYPQVFPVGWTLTYEIRFYLVVALALMMLRGSGATRFLAVGAAISAGVMLSALGIMPQEIMTTPLMIEFLFGAAAAALALRTQRLAITAGALALLYFAGAIVWLYAPERLFTLRVYAFGLPAAALLYGAMALEVSSRVRVPSFLVRAGNASYSCYLWHIPITSFVLYSSLISLRAISGDHAAIFTHPMAVIAYVVILIGAVALLSRLSFRYIERPLIAWSHGEVFRWPPVRLQPAPA